MDDNDGDGVYTITVSMTAGTEYKFLGNGDEPGRAVRRSECYDSSCRICEHVITVEGPGGETVCYNTCSACPTPSLVARTLLQQLQRGRGHGRQLLCLQHHVQRGQAVGVDWAKSS